jgi:hypothetical protein
LLSGDEAQAAPGPPPAGGGRPAWQPLVAGDALPEGPGQDLDAAPQWRRAPTADPRRSAGTARRGPAEGRPPA